MATVLAPVSFSFELNITICDSITSERRTCPKNTLGTLRYGDYGLRTGGTLGLGRDIMCSVVPTVASSQRCIVEGFDVVQRGVVRGTEDGMKK